MPLDPKEHLPVYEQIIEHICGLIAAGIHKPGEPLPSIRALALELIVNPNTVQRAYQELERLQLVRTRKGLGVFVTDNGFDVARRTSEAAVHARFAQGIKVGQAAKLHPGRLETIFRKALNGDADSRDTAAPDRPRNTESKP